MTQESIEAEEVTPKYKIGDRVYFIEGFQIESRLVTAIAFRQRYPEQNIGEVYYSVNTITDFSPVYISKKEAHLFKSRKELIRFLEKEVLD